MTFEKIPKGFDAIMGVNIEKTGIKKCEQVNTSSHF